MSAYVESIWFQTCTCYKCGLPFGMTQKFYDERQKRGDSFYCPSGHGQIFTETTEHKLRKEITSKDEMLQNANARAGTLSASLGRIERAHKRMRVRVMNGVCPCCNRSFSNLREHMKTQHADYTKEKTLRGLRDAFGMTQHDVAKEAYVEVLHVSLFERGKPIKHSAETRLQKWIERVSA